MVTLTIKKKNGDLYWTEKFQTLVEAKRWLAEEKTRFYWEKSFEVELDDKTKEDQSEESLRVEKMIKVRDRQFEIMKKLKGLNRKDVSDIDHVKDLLFDVLELMGFKGD